MIIIRLSGGLGNQMQQYALYRALLQKGKDVCLDVLDYDAPASERTGIYRERELDRFLGLTYASCTLAQRKGFLDRDPLIRLRNKLLPSTSRIFHEQKMYHPEIFSFTDKYLFGYFHCYAYQKDVMEALQKDFVFPPHTEEEGRQRTEALLSAMRGQDSVSLHLRRTDYVNDPVNEALFGGIATDAYYDAAIAYALAHGTDPVFYLFTDDPDYARDFAARRPALAGAVIVTGNTGENSMIDMQLMSACRVNICANSTFSVWGGRLNRRPDAIRIRTLTMRNNQKTTAEEMQGYWPDWVLIDADGRIA